MTVKPADIGVLALVMGPVLALLAIPVGHAASAAYETDLAALINQYRDRHQLPPLAPDVTLAKLAREHSATMARNARLSQPRAMTRRSSGFSARTSQPATAMKR